MSNRSLERQQIEHLIGDEPLGQAPLDAGTDYAVKPITEGKLSVYGSDRLQAFEKKLESIIKDQRISPEDTAVCAQKIKNTFKLIMGKYYKKLSDNSKALLDETLYERVDQIVNPSDLFGKEEKEKKGMPQEESAYRVLAMVILTDIAEIYEMDARQKLFQKNPSVLDSSETVEALEAKGSGILRARTGFRLALLGLSAWSSVDGAMAILSWLASNEINVLPHYVASKPVEILAWIGALVLSEQISKHKAGIEAVGSTHVPDNVREKQFSTFDKLRATLGLSPDRHGLPLWSATRTYFKDRKALAIVMATCATIDVSTNIYGFVDIFYGGIDTIEQVAHSRKTTNGNKNNFSEKIEDSQKAGVRELSSRAAMELLVREANGTYSNKAGIGPRFYGIGAALFPADEYYEFTGKSDSKCPEGMGDEDRYTNILNKGKANEINTEFIVRPVEDGSWCAIGHYGNNHVGWVIGEAAGTGYNLVDTLNAKSSRYGGDYLVANRLVSEFQSDHSTGYVDSLEPVYQAHIVRVSDFAEEKFDDIDAIVGAWSRSSTTLEMQIQADELINPKYDELEVKQDTLHKEMLEQMKAAYQPFIDFDAKLVSELAPGSPSIEIDAPEIEPLKFKFEKLELSPTVKDFFSQIKDVNEKYPMSFIGVPPIILLAVVISYLDLFLFYRRVQKRYADEAEELRKKATKLWAEHTRNLLELLHTHLNRGPFKKHFTNDNDNGGVSETFIKERLISTLESLAEDTKNPIIEEGLVSSVIKGAYNKVRAGFSLDLWKDLLSEGGRSRRWDDLMDDAVYFRANFADALRNFIFEESPVLISNKAVVRAVELYSRNGWDMSEDENEEELNIYKEDIMNVGIGGDKKEIVELIRDLFKRNIDVSGDEFAKKVREEIQQRWAMGAETKQPAKTLSERVNLVISAIDELRRSMNVQSEEWIVKYMHLQLRVEQELKSVVLLDVDKAEKQKLFEANQRFKKEYVRKIQERESQLRAGIRSIHDQLDADNIRKQLRHYEPEFSRLESGIKGALYNVAPGNYKTVVNPHTALKALDDRLDRLRDLKQQVRKLQPSANEVRRKKVGLLKLCEEVESNLLQGKHEFENEIVETIYDNRFDTLFYWRQELLDMEVSDPESAEHVLNKFMTTYNDFFQGAPGYVEIDLSNPDFETNGLLEAFRHLEHQVRNNMKEFSLDYGTSRSYDYAWHIGQALNKALNMLESHLEIEVNKLKDLRFKDPESSK